MLHDPQGNLLGQVFVGQTLFAAKKTQTEGQMVFPRSLRTRASAPSGSLSHPPVFLHQVTCPVECGSWRGWLCCVGRWTQQSLCPPTPSPQPSAPMGQGGSLWCSHPLRPLTIQPSPAAPSCYNVSANCRFFRLSHCVLQCVVRQPCPERREQAICSSRLPSP